MAAVTLSNFNQIDFNTILNLVMTQAAMPVTRMQEKQVDLETAGTAYGLLATKIGALETAAASLSTTAHVTQFGATVSDPTALTAVATSGAVAGTYDVVVKRLAQSQVTASSSTAATADATEVATGGSITIGGVEVTVTGSVTLKGLAELINAKAGIPATASVVESAPGAFRLVLTSTNTGAANAFTVTNGLTGAVAFLDADRLDAVDASITVNGLDITSSSNTLTTAINGSTLTLLNADAAKHLRVSVTTNNAALGGNVQTLVTAYNDLITFIQGQGKAAATGEKGTLANESILREARSALRGALGGGYGTGTFTHLAEVGIGLDRTGMLTLDQAALTSALTADRASVVNLFAGTGANGQFTNGAFGTLQAAMAAFTRSGGFVSSAQTQLRAQTNRLATQISEMQERLAIQKITLQREYMAADLAMQTLKQQSGSLGNMSSNQGSGWSTNG